MGGPIVRTGTTPKFWENYDKIFGDKEEKKETKSKKKTGKKTAKKKAPKPKAKKK